MAALAGAMLIAKLTLGITPGAFLQALGIGMRAAQLGAAGPQQAAAVSVASAVIGPSYAARRSAALATKPPPRLLG